MLKKKILDVLKNINRTANKKPETCYAILYNFKINNILCDCTEGTGCKYGPQMGLIVTANYRRMLPLKQNNINIIYNTGTDTLANIPKCP